MEAPKEEESSITEIPTLDLTFLQIGITDQRFIMSWTKKTLDDFREDNRDKFVDLVAYLEKGWADFMADLCGGRQ